jgi:hypothetical protein
VTPMIDPESGQWRISLWQLLGRVMPDYDERKQELAKRGVGL